MLEPKQLLSKWSIKSNPQHYDVINNQAGQMICDIYNRDLYLLSHIKPSKEEAAFNAQLIAKAPEMLLGLINLRDQLFDKEGEENVLTASIDSIIKDLVK